MISIGALAEWFDRGLAVFTDERFFASDERGHKEDEDD